MPFLNPGNLGCGGAWFIVIGTGWAIIKSDDPHARVVGMLIGLGIVVAGAGLLLVACGLPPT